MMGLRILAGVTLALLVPCATLANPGLHAHLHLANSGTPLLDLHPALSLAATLIIWGAAVTAVEAFTRRWHAAA